MWGTSSTYPSITSFAKAKEVFETTKPLRGTNDRPLEARSRNCKSWIEKRGENYIIRLYQTDIVTYYPDGSVFLNIRGWATNATASALHAMSPFTCWKRGGQLIVSLGRPSYGDGLKFVIPNGGLLFKPDETGALLPVNPPPAVQCKKQVKKEEAKKSRAFFKQVPVYIKTFSAAFEGGTEPEVPEINMSAVWERQELSEDQAVALAWCYVTTGLNESYSATVVVNDPKTGIAEFWKYVYRALKLIETVETVLPYGEVPK